MNTPPIVPRKKNFLVFSFYLLLLSLTPSQAQTPLSPDYPCRRDIERGNYDRVAQRLEKKLAKDSSDAALSYAAYCLYFSDGYIARSTPLAYRHLLASLRAYIHADARQLNRLTRDNFSPALYNHELRLVCRRALVEAADTGTVDALRRYLLFYTQAPPDIRDSAVLLRDSLEFNIASLSATVADIEDFLTRRPTSVYAPQATRLRDSIAFNIADNQHTVESYTDYTNRYPSSTYSQRALDSIHLIAFRIAEKLDAEHPYRAYSERYPLSPLASEATSRADSIQYLRSIHPGNVSSYLSYLDNTSPSNRWHQRALSELSAIAINSRNLNIAGQALIRFTPHLQTLQPNLHQQIINLIHDAYMLPSVRNYPLLYNKYGHLLPDTLRQRDSLAYTLNERYHYAIIDSCIRLIAPCHEAYLLLQQLIGDDIRYSRFDNARDKALTYQHCFANSHEYQKLLSLLATPDAEKIKPTPLPPSVNTLKGDEYCAVPSPDDKTLFFAAKNRPDNLGGEDIFYTQKTSSGAWGKAQIEMSLSHIYGNEAPVSLSTDGTRILTFQSGALYMAEKSADGWHHPQKLPPNINISSWQADAMIASNGRALLFAAFGGTERDPDSSVNIYVSLKDSSGHWSAPIELGPRVNTPFVDRSPVLHPDMRTLYFCSEGHGSLGQLDVFVTRRLHEDSWTEWSEPVNIGKQINTVDDDCWYRITTDGTKAYFSLRKRSQDLYWLSLPHDMRPDPVAIITGSITKTIAKTKKERVKDARLEWVDLTTGKLIGEAHVDPVSGKFFIVLPLGHLYGLKASNTEMETELQEIDLREETKAVTKTLNLSVLD